MSATLLKVKKLALLIRSCFPSKLPTGVEEFHDWVESFFHIFDMPTQDRDSVKNLLSTCIMHLGPQSAHKSKLYFYLTMKASAAKQVAHHVFQELHLERQKQAEAKPVEAAPAESTQPNGPQV